MNSVKYLLVYMELFCDMFGSVLECFELIHISWSCKSKHALLPHWLCNQKHPYVVVVQLLTFLNLHFIMEWLLQSYFSQKINLNRHIKHENPLSIYENVDYFQIMSITNLEWFCINCSMIWKIAIRLPNMPVLPLDCHLPTQYTTHTIKLQ